MMSFHVGVPSQSAVEDLQKKIAYHETLLERHDDRIQQLECSRTFVILTDKEGLLKTDYLKPKGEEKKRGALDATIDITQQLAPPDYMDVCADVCADYKDGEVRKA
eukprot:GEMP01078464.1.p2 GENE.GEMP01078464.1~~GEMP01078464.1.p2  ORF type:complete len:106 (+),score=23.27 GEMP01078464.1:79-396(+)